MIVESLQVSFYMEGNAPEAMKIWVASDKGGNLTLCDQPPTAIGGVNFGTIETSVVVNDTAI
jgi:hypothetical protein